jgi:hypothetical protein
MKKHKILIFTSVLLVLSTLSFSQNIQFESSYTDISKNCKTIKTYENTKSATFDCGTFANISIEIETDDDRDFLTLIRENKRHALELGSAITPLFRELGEKMEWRYPKGQKNKPMAMIVRLNINIEGETQKDQHTDSYLIVSKITKDSICLVDKVAPHKNQNKIAREIADKSSSMSCLIEREINKKIYK